MKTSPSTSKCSACREGLELPFAISMAFQPLVRLSEHRVIGYEALVRGKNNEGAGHILSQVTPENRYQFDQACRVTAIAQAAQLGLNALLSINFMPNAVYQPELCIRATMAAAQQYKLDPSLIMFEFTESEQMLDIGHVTGIIKHYQRLGFKTAIDDFGAGYSGLIQLAAFQTDFLKLDMALIRDIHLDPTKQAILRHTLALCRELNIELLAEGVEHFEELEVLQKMGVDLFQGYLLAKPGFEHFPSVNWP